MEETPQEAYDSDPDLQEALHEAMTSASITRARPQRRLPSESGQEAVDGNPLAKAEMEAAVRGEGLIEAELPLAGEMVTGDALRAELGLEAEEAEALAKQIEYQHAHPEEARPRKPRVPRVEREEAAMLRSKMATPDEDMVEVDLDER